eukprot:2074730-Amphidinium_carterae.1
MNLRLEQQTLQAWTEPPHHTQPVLLCAASRGSRLITVQWCTHVERVVIDVGLSRRDGGMLDLRKMHMDNKLGAAMLDAERVSAVDFK